MLNGSLIDYIYGLKIERYATNVGALEKWSEGKLTGAVAKVSGANKYNPKKYYHYGDYSGKLGVISLDSIKGINDAYGFIKDIIPRIGERIEVDADFDKSQEK